MEKTELIEKHELLKKKIEEAEVVLIGIGEEFNERFKDISKFPQIIKALDKINNSTYKEWLVPFVEKIYLEEKNNDEIIEAYKNLFAMVKDKNYFVVTTCIDSKIFKAGFDEEKVVQPCGSYKNLQCCEKCSTELYSPIEIIQQIKNKIENNEGFEELEKPICPICNSELVFNNILCEGNYVEEGYLPLWEKYTKWLQFTLNKKICVLELGVGMNMPNIIRWPFEKIAFYNKKTSFFRINETLYQMSEEIADKGVSIEANTLDFFNECI